MLKQKFIRFMYGRYGASAGIDGLGWFLFISYFVLSFAARFFGGIPRVVLSALATAAVVYMFFRFFSKNIYARQKENGRFMSFFRKAKAFFKLQKDRVRDRKTHVYKKCTKCKAVIRLPRKKGKHTVVCPKCSERFEVKNLF